MAIQEQAKTQKKGRWVEDDKIQSVRNVIWNIEDPRAFINKYKNKRIEAVVEQVN